MSGETQDLNQDAADYWSWIILFGPDMAKMLKYKNLEHVNIKIYR